MKYWVEHFFCNPKLLANIDEFLAVFDGADIADSTNSRKLIKL